MSNWKAFSLNQVPPIPTAAQAARDAGSVAADVFDAAATGLDALSAALLLLSDRVDLSAAMQTLVNQLYDLFGSGVYMYFDEGPVFNKLDPDGLSGMKARFTASFDDTGDGERPQFSGDAEVSALLIAIGANELPDLANLLDMLLALFGLPQIDPNYPPGGLDIDWPTRTESGMSTPPDWTSGTLADVVPLYGRLLDLLKRLAGMLNSGSTYSDIVDQLAAACHNKAIALRDFADELEAVINALAALATSGAYVVNLQSSSGVAGLIEQLQAAENPPPWGADAYVSGVCLLGGTADFGPVVELMGG